MNEVFAFEVSVKGTDWKDIVNHRSASKARRAYHDRVTDPWPDVKLSDVKARKIGPPHTSEAFERNAKYRGMPDVKCGRRVKVGNATGVIVGHNGSANFNVLFDEDAARHAGEVLNVHPAEVELLK